MLDGECVLRSEAAVQRTVRRHDGLYIHLGLGVGYLSGDLTVVDDDESVSDTTEFTLSGSVTDIAQLGEFAVGGTVADGVVLGGGVWGTNAFSPSYEGSARDVFASINREGTIELEGSGISQLGPFVRWYFDATRGAHVELAPTFAIVALGDERSFDPTLHVQTNPGYGWGLVASAGYDFWIGEQWSLGVGARLSYVSVNIERLKKGSEFWALVPGLMATATFH